MLGAQLLGCGLVSAIQPKPPHSTPPPKLKKYENFSESRDSWGGCLLGTLNNLCIVTRRPPHLGATPEHGTPTHSELNPDKGTGLMEKQGQGSLDAKERIAGERRGQKRPLILSESVTVSKKPKGLSGQPNDPWAHIRFIRVIKSPHIKGKCIDVVGGLTHDGKFQVWENGKPILPTPIHVDGSIDMATISPNGEQIAFIYDTSLWVYKISEEKTQLVHRATDLYYPTHVDYNSNGGLLAIGTLHSKKTVLVYDTKDFTKPLFTVPFNGHVESLSFGPDPKSLAVVALEREQKLPEKMECTQEIAHPNVRLMIVKLREGTVGQEDKPYTLREVRLFHEQNPTAFKYTKFGAFASCGNGVFTHTFTFEPKDDYNMRRFVNVNEERVRHYAILPQGGLITGGDDGVKWWPSWNAPPFDEMDYTGSPKRLFPDFNPKNRPVTKLCVSADEKHVVVVLGKKDLHVLPLDPLLTKG